MPKIYLSFSATDQTLKRDCSTEIIAGSKSYFLAVFKLSDSWMELDNVKAVFSRGNEVPILMDLTDRDDGAVECVIPWEVTDRAGAFMVGLRGGDLLKTNCAIVYVKQGCAADGIPGRDPTEDWVRRIERSIGNLDDLDTTAKENLVAAINEALTKGGGEVDPEEIQKIVEEYLADNPPAPGEDGKSAYEIALENGFTGTESDWLASLKGEQGPQGPQGETGNTGATPNIQIGTVETLAAGSEATASMTGTAENPILNLGIPQGAPGDGGEGGLSSTAAALLIEILQNAVYTTNMSGKIDALKEALASGGSGDSGGDSGGETVADDITVSDGVMTIVSVGSEITVSDGVMTIT